MSSAIVGGPGDLQRLPDTRCEADSMAEGRAGALLALGRGQLPLPSHNPMEESPKVQKGLRGQWYLDKAISVFIDAVLLGPLLCLTSLV